MNSENNLQIPKCYFHTQNQPKQVCVCENSTSILKITLKCVSVEASVIVSFSNTNLKSTKNLSRWHFNSQNKLKLPKCDYLHVNLSKITKRPFTRKDYRAKDPLELVHSDLCVSDECKSSKRVWIFHLFYKWLFKVWLFIPNGT